ncbi:MAG: PaaI family thioesterase [Gaiellales bacterium]
MNEDLIRQLIEGAPLPTRLGIRLAHLAKDRAELQLPFAEHVVTIGDIVHGGSISALIDTAATAAAWATEDIPENLRGTTVSLTVTFLSAARGEDITAAATVIARGRSLCFMEVDVTTASGTAVAKGLVTYKMG